MADLLSESERDRLAEAIYLRAVSPIVHNIAGLQDGDPHRQGRMNVLTESMQGCAMASLNAAEQWSAVRRAYRAEQEIKRERITGKEQVVMQEIEVKSDVLKPRKS